jgi:hypothetical protein
VLDRSGSMAAVADDPIGGFNQFLLDQKSAPPAVACARWCNSTTNTIRAQRQTLARVPPLSSATFIPRGSTALLDAIARAIGETHESDRQDR